MFVTVTCFVLHALFCMLSDEPNIDTISSNLSTTDRAKGYILSAEYSSQCCSASFPETKSDVLSGIEVNRTIP